MQCELVYYGKWGDVSYLDNLPWNQFVHVYNWLSNTKKQEKENQDKAQKEHQAAMDSMKARTRARRGRW